MNLTAIKKSLCLFLLLSIFISSCIKDDRVEDFVEPQLRFTTTPDSILVNSTYQFEYIYLNNIGIVESVQANWMSSAPNILEIDANGLATALAIGKATVTVSYDDLGNLLEESIDVQVGMTTIEQPAMKSGTVNSTSTYALKGDFTLTASGPDLILQFGADYKASTALPGLYVYLSNNNSTTNGALEIARVETFNGAHSYMIKNVGINDYEYVLYYCKPFNVKVGDGKIE